MSKYPLVVTFQFKNKQDLKRAIQAFVKCAGDLEGWSEAILETCEVARENDPAFGLDSAWRETKVIP